MMDRKIIVALGDSITYGYPYTPNESWVYRVAGRCGQQIINQGICGDTTGDMAARFARDVLPLKPDAVILLGGANDIFSCLDLGTMTENMAGMVYQAEQQGILPILGLPTPCDFDEKNQLSEFRLWIIEFACEQSLPVIDFYTHLLSDKGKFVDGLAVDGIHPSLQGYKRMAEIAAPVLDSLVLRKQETQD
jgi:lysophospholipase L1-like esterase